MHHATRTYVYGTCSSPKRGRVWNGVERIASTRLDLPPRGGPTQKLSLGQGQVRVKDLARLPVFANLDFGHTDPIFALP